MGFQDLSWNISVSSLVIVVASAFEISCGKTNIQTDRQTPVKTLPPRLPSLWVINVNVIVNAPFDRSEFGFDATDNH